MATPLWFSCTPWRRRDDLFCAGTSAIKRCEFSVAKRARSVTAGEGSSQSALSYVLKWIGNHIEALSVGNDK